MKLLFIVLLSVFTIESTLASPKWCRDSLSKIGIRNTLTAYKMSHTWSSSRLENMIEKVLKTQEPAVAEAIFIQALKKSPYPSNRRALIEALTTVTGKETQLALINLFNSEDMNYVRTAIIKTLSKIDNPLDELFNFMIQILSKQTIYFRKDVLKFLENKKGPQVTEGYKQLLVISNDLMGHYHQESLMKQILETQEPEVAEDIFLHALPIEIVQNSHLQNQENFIKSLEILTKKQPQAGKRAQFTLVNLYNSINTISLIKHAIIKTLLDIEKPLDEVFPVMIEISEDDSNPLQNQALEFLKKHKQMI